MKKKILFVYTDNFAVYDIAWAFLELGYEMEFFDKKFQSYTVADQSEIKDMLAAKLESDAFWFVLSYNFILEISDVCQNKKLPYVAWTYDSLTLTLFTKQIHNSYNFIHIFDHDEYIHVRERFHPEHVYYMPLAANMSRIGGTIITDEDVVKFSAEVSFIGNLYDKDELMKIEQMGLIPDTIRHYIDYLIAYYVGRWDGEQIYDCMDVATCNTIKQYMPEGYLNTYDIPDTYYYPFIMLGRRIANRDRMYMLEALAKQFPVSLFGPKKELPFTIDQRGSVDYGTEFAKVAHLSKINLHLTMPRIATGVSLRCFDVMGAGGFLMANYKADMVKLFEPNRDFVMFETLEELERKIDYYLKHDAERMQIAQNGCRKVMQYHTCEHRALEMLCHLEEAGFGWGG